MLEFIPFGFASNLGNLPTLGHISGLFGNIELIKLTDEANNYLTDENLKQLVVDG